MNLFGHLHRPFFLHFPPLIQFGRQTTGNKSYNTRQRRRARLTFSTIISLKPLLAVTQLRSNTNSSVPAAVTADWPPAAPSSPARGTLALVLAYTDPAVPEDLRTVSFPPRQCCETDLQCLVQGGARRGRELGDSLQVIPSPSVSGGQWPH